MTDNEIIKALECCSVNAWGNCRGCPLLNDYSPCGVKLTANALELINRQKAEVERLNNELNSARVFKPLYEELKAEHLETVRLIKTAETEAVKRFAEKLVALDDIEKITKEMVGDE